MSLSAEIETEVEIVEEPTEKTKFDINEMITNQIIDMIEKAESNGDKLTWKKMWENFDAKSFTTKKSYRGINTILLAFSPFKSNYWITWKQVQELGGKVKDSETKNSRPVVFWNFKKVVSKDGSGATKTNKDGSPAMKQVCWMKYYRVYNLDQCENIPEKKMPKDVEGHSHPVNCIDCCENVINNMPNKPEIQYSGSQPCYMPSMDTVQVPVKEHFKTIESFYDTMFHELAHSTGHDSRLKRDLTGRFGSNDYTKEELIAQLSASMLSNHCGNNDSSTMENSAASQGGLEAIGQVNQRKAGKLYTEIDRTGFYRGTARTQDRSLMNVTFRLATEELEKTFVKESTAAGFDGLKGHRAVGGMRASIYNAFPEDGIDALVSFMREFERRNG